MIICSYLSGIIGILTAFVHSYLGEKRLIGPLLSSPEYPRALRSSISRSILRGVWHLPSLYWALMGLMTIVVTAQSSGRMEISLVFALAGYVLSGIISLIATRGRSIGWFLLFSAAVFLFLGLLAS